MEVEVGVDFEAVVVLDEVVAVVLEAMVLDEVDELVLLAFVDLVLGRSMSGLPRVYVPLLRPTLVS